MPIHLALIGVDIYIYDIQILSIFINFIFIWLDFYNYMTLYKVTIIIEIVCLILTTLIAISHFQRLILENFDWIVFLTYFIHFGFINIIAAVVIFKRLKLHFY
jgi:hypothetical protein